MDRLTHPAADQHNTTDLTIVPTGEPNMSEALNTPETLAQEATLVGIELLDPKAKLPDVVAKLNELITKLNELSSTPQPKARDRGPDSQREMTEEDARRVVIGDLEQLSHKDAAIKLGLSYGQIYSARKGHTFKGVYKELRDREAAKK